MFYAHFVVNKKGPLARIWLAAHWDKKLTRAHVFETNISSSVEAILEPKLKMALRTSGHLLLGVVRIYSRKAKYLLADCNEAFVKIKMAFRPGVVDLPDDTNREAAITAITLPENMHDFEATIADLNEINMNTIAINQSRPEDITMREDFGEINIGRQDDDFGDSAFEESSREVIRGGDKTFGSDGVYRHSGQLSVRDSDFGVRSDIDIDNTLMGEAGLNLDKDKHTDITARPDDLDMDDNDFGPEFLGGADDDDEHFGGEIDQTLFATADIFSDPSARKEFDVMTSEFESHLAAADAAGGDATSLGLESVSKAVDSVEQQQTATSALESNLSTATTTKPGTSSNLTLLTNDSQAFALPPIDATAMTGMTEPRKHKRRRRLIVDEQRSIPSETMKQQMEDTSDIVTQLDLAPSTRKLMRWKATGSVDKLFSLPGHYIPSRVLQSLFTRNMTTSQMPDDVEGDDQQVSLRSAMQQLAQKQTSSAAAASGNDSRISGQQSSISNDDFALQRGPAERKLGVIAEEEEQSNKLSAPGTDPHQPPSGGGESGKLDTLEANPFSPINADLNFMSADTPYLAPPSVLSEAPVGMFGGETGQDHVNDAFGSPAAAPHDDFFDDDIGGGYLSPGEDDDVAAVDESAEERRLEKRSKVMLRMLHSFQQQHGWDRPLSLKSICSGNTKKQAASKFYTILLLRKQLAVELTQDAPYEDINISCGPHFARLINE